MTFCSSELHVVSRWAHYWYEMNLWWLSEVMLNLAWSGRVERVFSSSLSCLSCVSCFSPDGSYNSALIVVRCDYRAAREPETLFKVVIVFLSVYCWWHHLFLCLSVCRSPGLSRSSRLSVLWPVCLSCGVCALMREESEMIFCPSVLSTWLVINWSESSTCEAFSRLWLL